MSAHHSSFSNNFSVFYEVTYSTTLKKIGEILNKTLLPEVELTLLKKHCDRLQPKLGSSTLKTQLQDYYGQLDTHTLNNKIDQLFENTLSLLAKKHIMPKELMRSKVQELQTQLTRLWYNHALSKLNRRFIRIAVYNLNLLELFLSSKTTTVLRCNSHNDSLSKDNDMLSSESRSFSAFNAEESERAEFAFDLCEIAHFFYQNKIDKGMKKLHQLSPSQKIRLEEICILLGVKKPDLFITENLIQYQNEIICFVQALVGYANEIAQNHSLMDKLFIPSKSEIHMMFQEVEKLALEQ